MEILYDWRGMPIEFIQQQQPTGSSGNSLFRLTMAYDGTGRRISKTRWVKSANSQDWEKELVTHYTGIGTEVRESFTGPAAETKVVVNMPNGLGRYGIEDAAAANANASKNFEWYLKNHLGSTMLVYGTVASTNPSEADVGTRIAAYDYRAFGEMLELTPPATGKVTENFTGKEHDDEISLDYFGARYLDPMLGMWISVDPKRQFSSPYLYAGNGYNPVNGVDPDGNIFANEAGKMLYQKAVANNFWGNEDIRREYEFANTTSTKIFVKRQYQFIGSRKLCGSTMEGVKDQINLINGVRDDYKMLEANVTLSTMGNKVWAEALNISIDEAEARIATHEFGAHIRGFSPKTNPEEREQIEHDNFMEIDQRLQIPEEPSGDDLRYQYKAYE